jgi:hypothetical protein
MVIDSEAAGSLRVDVAEDIEARGFCYFMLVDHHTP